MKKEFSSCKRRKKTGKSPRSLAQARRYWLPREEYPGFRTCLREDLLLGLLGAVTGCLIGGLFYKSIRGLVLALPLAYLALRTGRHKLALRRKELLRKQLRDYLISVISFLRAGYALENAMIGAEKEMDSMYGEASLIGTEAGVMSRHLSLQTPPEQLWTEFGKRTGLPEGEQLAKVFSVAKRQGGDYLPVLKSLVQMMDNSFSLKTEIATLLTGKRLEYYLMCLIPSGMLGYLNLSSPEMTRSLYEGKGPLFMSLFLLLYAAGILWGDRILEKSYEP